MSELRHFIRYACMNASLPNKSTVLPERDYGDFEKNDDVTFTTPLHIHTQVPITWHNVFLSLEIIFLMGSSRPDRKCPRSHLHQISSQKVRSSVARNSSDVFAGQ